MADNKKWFKVWTQILTDPSFDDIHNQAIGAWVRLGALVAYHGDSGEIEISKKQLLKRMHLSIETKQDALQLILKDLEKINVKVTENGNDTCFVSFKNWGKYQADWNSYERLKKWRETQRETVQDKKKKEKKNRSRIEVEGDKKKSILLIPYEEIISDLNEKAEKNYKHTTKDIQMLIRGRWEEGFVLEDFQKVHDNMCLKWKNDPKMNQYLRPSTLYQQGKFQGYLNAKQFLSDRGIVTQKTEKSMQVMKDWVEGGNDVK